jgi:hypothetical protein
VVATFQVTKPTAFVAGAALCAAVFGCAGRPSQTNEVHVTSPGQPGAAQEQLVPGDYNVGGQGSYRRIVVSIGPTLYYDIWQAAPHGKFEHFHFVLSSPAQHPVESDKYRARSKGRDCGQMSLHYYRDKNGEYPVLILRDNKAWQPFGSGGDPLTSQRYSEDAAYVTKIWRSSRNPGFYDTLTKWERKDMHDLIPRCG